MTSGSTTAMRSILFTDLVGSTELRVRLGEASADALRRAHDLLLAEVVGQHGGSVVKGLGDGVLAVFDSASDAVLAGIAVQQAAEQHGREQPDLAFALRVGISVGDVSLEDGDVFGVPVVEAARLCDAAVPSEVLVADLVRALARGRAGAVFEPMGDVELKGLGEPLAVCRVLWQPIPPATGDVPLPPLLVANQVTAYVGRADVLRQAAAAREAARRGTSRLLLLSGEPGVGKTRTAAELARTAYTEGAVVLYGRCDEDLGVPFQPFSEMLAHYLTHAGTPVLGRLPAELTRVCPGMAAAIPGQPQAISADPVSEQQLLFESTASWLVDLSSSTELVLVVDDLHWASKPALLLLLYVVRAAMAEPSCRMLVVGTYRDTDIDRTHPLSELIADLRRLPGVERLGIAGLSGAEVEELLEAAAGRELDAEARRLARVLRQETEGNPFFVAEVVRHLVETGVISLKDTGWAVEEGAELSIPEGVRDVVGRRVSRLSPTAGALLSAASVLGRDVRLDVLAEVVDLTEDEILDALDEAMRSRLLEEVSADVIRFSHALVRTTLYEELTSSRRRRQHRRVAQAIEKLHPHDLVGLAHHFVQAGPEGGEMTRALSYSLAAADQAQQSHALAEAESRYREVLEILHDLETEGGRVHALALCGVGECQRDQGVPYRDTLLSAARIARAAGEPDVMARALWANSRGTAAVVSAVDTEVVELAESALQLLPEELVVERARVLSSLATELTFAPDYEHRRAIAQEAIAAARTLDPALGMPIAIRSAPASGSLDSVHELMALTVEGIEVGERTGDAHLEFLSKLWHSGTSMTLGDLRASSAETRQLHDVAKDLAPTYRWFARTYEPRCLAFEGRLAEAAALNDVVLAEGMAVGASDADQWWGSIVYGLANLRGEQGALIGFVRPLAETFPDFSSWRYCLAHALASTGQPEEARDILLADLGPGPLVHNPFLGSHLAIAVQTNHFLRDPEIAQVLLTTAEPYLDYWGHYFTFVTAPLSLVPALSWDVLGEPDRSLDALQRTRTQTEAAGYVGLLPLLDTFRVELLARNGRDATEALADVRRGAEQVGAPALVARAEAAVAAGLDP